MMKLRLIMLIFFLLLPVKAKASTITYNTPLYFGRLVATGTVGRLTIGIDGNASNITGVRILQGGYSGDMTYQGRGLLGIIIDLLLTLSITTETVVLTNAYPGSPPVTVDNIVIHPSSTTLLVSILGTGQINDIKIGGRINFTSPPRGTYSGVIGVNVSSLLGITANANGTIPVQVDFINVLTINETASLSFGAINVAGTGSGEVKVLPSGTRVLSSGSGISFAANGPAPSAGIFSITGEPNQAINVAVPASLTLTNSNGNSLELSDFVTSGEDVLDELGKRDLRVGANATISPNQPSGIYTGTYTINVNY